MRSLLFAFYLGGLAVMLAAHASAFASTANVFNQLAEVLNQDK